MPLIAALPYAITAEDNEVGTSPRYDAISQLVVHAGGRDYSTSREDDSAGGLFSTKGDTKKDD